jgi:hypothetical protein
MAGVAATLGLVADILSLRRAEKVQEARPDVAPVRRELEAQLGSTLSRSRASRILGVSQTALDRWVAAGQIPIVVTPTGRREVPRRFVIELSEAVRRLQERGQGRHLLATALAERKKAAARAQQAVSRAARGHGTAERRSLAYHQAIADRLDAALADEARAEVERLVREGHLHPRYAERWREVLSLPRDRIAAAITAEDQDANDLRQNSPFAGFLNEQERRQIIETVR